MFNFNLINVGLAWDLERVGPIRNDVSKGGLCIN